MGYRIAPTNKVYSGEVIVGRNNYLYRVSTNRTKNGYIGCSSVYALSNITKGLRLTNISINLFLSSRNFKKNICFEFLGKKVLLVSDGIKYVSKREIKILFENTCKEYLLSQPLTQPLTQLHLLYA